MSNRKKIKSKDGATRIAKSEEICGLYKLQMYNDRRGVWENLEGCTRLTWTEATTARKNFVALRGACKVANGASPHINVPADEVHRN